MTPQISKKEITWALAACAASLIILGYASHPGSALPMAAPAASERTATNDASSFDTDIADRGTALLIACRDDAVRLCASVTPGQGRVVHCLAERRDDLSDYCRSAMIQRHLNRERHRQALQD